jgi:addiction module HigA family antidote
MIAPGSTAFASMTNGESVLCGGTTTHTMSKSWTTTKGSFMSKRDFPPIHPGEILREEFLIPLGISQYRLAKEIHVPARRINEIVLEKRGISADTALRLGRYFGTTAQLWINLQARYDLEVARDAIADKLETEIKPLQRAA